MPLRQLNDLHVIREAEGVLPDGQAGTHAPLLFPASRLVAFGTAVPSSRPASLAPGPLRCSESARRQPQSAMDRFDVILVGAGSSGGVIASRLTEDQSLSVILIEAGRDFPREKTTPPLFTVSGEHSWLTAGVPEFDWELTNTDGAGTLGGRSIWLPRGRLVGGTSMINATIAARGAPFDFDRWAAMGNAGWAWADLLPLFIAIENDVDFGGEPIHGRDGPIVVQRYRRESWAPVNRAMYDACLELG